MYLKAPESSKDLSPSPRIYLLLTEFEGCTVSYGPSFFPIDLWPKHEVCGPYKIEGEKRGSVTYSTDRENEVSKIFIISLLCVWWGRGGLPHG